MRNVFSYSQLIFTMEFLISYCLNALPVFQLQKLGVIASVVLFLVHAFISICHNLKTEKRNSPEL